MHFLAGNRLRWDLPEADLYPRIVVIGTLGVEAEHFAGLFDSPSSMAGSVAPSIQWPILNYGRIINNVRAQDAQFEQLAFNYQDTVLRAGREAEDSIVAFLKAQEQTSYLAESVSAANRTLEITNDQYRASAVDFTAVFLFETTLTDQQDNLAVAQGNIAISLISLYRALGGGWEMRLTRDFSVAHDQVESSAPESHESLPLPAPK